MFKSIVTKDGRVYRPVSRWCCVRCIPVTSRHNLFDYAYDGILCGFRALGRWWACGQFERLSYPEMWEDKNGKLCYLSGVDMLCYYRPYFIQIDDNGEYVRLWEEITPD